VVTGAFLAARSFQAPVVLASVVKIAYDLGLYRAFRAYEAGQLAQDDDVPRREARADEASAD
jgi:hypothetical protein